MACKQKRNEGKKFANIVFSRFVYEIIYNPGYKFHFQHENRRYDSYQRVREKQRVKRERGGRGEMRNHKASRPSFTFPRWVVRKWEAIKVKLKHRPFLHPHFNHHPFKNYQSLEILVKHILHFRTRKEKIYNSWKSLRH